MVTTNHIFVDESKRHNYLLVAGALVPGSLADLRREFGALILPGQRSLHMKDERDARKHAIADIIVRANVEAVLYDAGNRFRSEVHRRAACLRELVDDIAAKDGETQLVIDRDDSLVQRDKQCLIEYSRSTGCVDSLSYRHQKPSQELLLIIPDAIAWCWAKGGNWRQRIRPVVGEVRNVA